MTRRQNGSDHIKRGSFHFDVAKSTEEIVALCPTSESIRSSPLVL